MDQNVEKVDTKKREENWK